MSLRGAEERATTFAKMNMFEICTYRVCPDRNPCLPANYKLHVVQHSDGQDHEVKVRVVVAQVKAEDGTGFKFFLYSTEFKY
jgi:hypothetical protein